jgi:citrate lyase alpha subunit
LTGEAARWQPVTLGRPREAIVAKIRRGMVEAMGTAAIRDKLAAQLTEPIGNKPAQFRAPIDGRSPARRR